MTATRNAKKKKKSIGLKSQKIFTRAAHFFLYISLSLFCTTSTHVKLTSCTLYGGKVVCVPTFHFFFFFTASHFNLAGRWRFPFSQRSFEFFMFFLVNYVSFFVCVFCFIFRSSSFSVIGVSVVKVGGEQTYARSRDYQILSHRKVFSFARARG